MASYAQLDPERCVASSTRALREQAVVESCLPAETRRLVAGGAAGWLYPVRSDLGDAFSLFAYFDGSGYQVKVVEPEVEGRHPPHAAHLFPDGRLCLGEDAGGGTGTLQEAYARSVLWCNGFSLFVRGGPFPF